MKTGVAQLRRQWTGTNINEINGLIVFFAIGEQAAAQTYGCTDTTPPLGAVHSASLGSVAVDYVTTTPAGGVPRGCGGATVNAKE